MGEKYIPITQKDIDSVPCARIFTPKLNDIIQETCKEILKESMTRVDDYRYDEVAIVLSIDGRKSRLIPGYNGEIDCSAEEYLFNVIGFPVNSRLMIHNHPNNSKVSLNDLIEMLSVKSILGVIAVGNSGGVSYVYKTTNDIAYYAKLGRTIAFQLSEVHDLDKYKKEEERIRLKLLNNPNDYKIVSGYSNRRRLG